MNLFLKPINREGRAYLIPAGEEDKKSLLSLRDDFVHCRIDQPRNVKHHRMFWAVARKCFDNWRDGDFKNVYDFVEAIKLECGYVRRVKRLDGSVYTYPKSISFTAADQKEFDVFYDKFIELMSFYFDTSVYTLENEAEDSN